MDTESDLMPHKKAKKDCFNNIDPAVDTERLATGKSIDSLLNVSTISIQQWILKVNHFIKILCFNLVSTISIQQWILKAAISQAGAYKIMSFNNIDPAVDTERQLQLSWLPHTSLVSTISIQQWILKVRPYSLKKCWSACFNNIDPAVDTESSQGESPTPAPVQVSTISIQQWILKEFAGERVNILLRCFNNIDPAVDTERILEHIAESLALEFQQYRSSSGY